MTEPELPRVQHLSGKISCKPRRINFVAQNRVSEVMQMNTDLMGPAGVQAAFDKARQFARAKKAIFGFGSATAE